MLIDFWAATGRGWRRCAGAVELEIPTHYELCMSPAHDAPNHRIRLFSTPCSRRWRSFPVNPHATRAGDSHRTGKGMYPQAITYLEKAMTMKGHSTPSVTPTRPRSDTRGRPAITVPRSNADARTRKKVSAALGTDVGDKDHAFEYLDKVSESARASKKGLMLTRRSDGLHSDPLMGDGQAKMNLPNGARLPTSYPREKT